MTDHRDDAPVLDHGFRAIFKAEFSYVCRSLRRCGIRDRDLEDLAHDAFLAAHLGFGDFDRTRPIKPWLFGIVFRIASHHRRRAGYQREALDDGRGTDRSDPAPLADEQLDEARKRRVVLDILETLELDRRAVLVMPVHRRELLLHRHAVRGQPVRHALPGRALRLPGMLARRVRRHSRRAPAGVRPRLHAERREVRRLRARQDDELRLQLAV